MKIPLKYGGELIQTLNLMLMKKKMMLFCMLMCIVSVILAQNQFASVSQKMLYMCRSYNITQSQYAKYGKELRTFQKERSNLKDKVISSEKYRQEYQKQLDELTTNVSLIFSSMQFEKWANIVRANDNYLYLSEELLTPIDIVSSIINLEEQVMDSMARIEMISDTKIKIQKRIDIYNYKKKKNNEILGSAIGSKYTTYKLNQWNAYKNMDRYNISYSDAEKIAIIERESSGARQGLWNSNKNNPSEYHRQLEANYNNKEVRLKQSLSKSVFDKWSQINKKTLDYELNTKYNLTSSQISKFKDLYNTYIIQEYSILYKSKLTKGEKLQKITEANKQFCDGVSKFFPVAYFEEWRGRRMYSFEKLLERKKIF